MSTIRLVKLPNTRTQLTLGIDRDSEIVAHIFDERDATVKSMIAQAIQS